MENSFWEKLLIDWSKVYYTGPIVMICSFFAIFFGIKNYRKEKVYACFVLFSVSCFLLFSLTDIIRLVLPFRSRNKFMALETCNVLFEFTELFVFYYYFLQIIKSTLIRSIMKLSLIIILFLVLLFFFKITNYNFLIFQINQFSTLISILVFFLLLIPIFIYFFETFNSDPINDIRHSPCLWITSGLFLYCLASLPFLLIFGYLYKSDRYLYYLMFSIHYVSLSFLFLTIIKAFIWRKPLTT